MIGTFLVGVILGRIVIRLEAKVWMGLTLTGVLLVVCSFIPKFFGALLLALAMGIQNSAANRFAGITLNHVFITGNLQKLGEEIVSWVWPSQGKQAKRESIIFVLAWFGYAMGAVSGTLAADFFQKTFDY